MWLVRRLVQPPWRWLMRPGGQCGWVADVAAGCVEMDEVYKPFVAVEALCACSFEVN